MRSSPKTVITFGAGGNATQYQMHGWAGPEDGRTWMVGSESALNLPAVDLPAGGVIEISAIPFCRDDIIPAQNVGILVNGTLIGVGSFVDNATFAWRLPRRSASEPFVITIRHPNASVPAACGVSPDDRSLALWVSRIRLLAIESEGTERRRVSYVPIGEASADIDALLLGFESVGDNCAFGILQRELGMNPLSLLRFAGASLQAVTAAVEEDFDSLADPDVIALTAGGPPDNEWYVTNRKYGIGYHTFIPPDDVEEQKMRSNEVKRMTFLRRKFLEDMASGAKCFVCRRRRPLTTEEILPLFLALNRTTPNSLLFIVPADGAHPVGTVEEVLPGLMRGYIDRLAPPGLKTYSPAGWLAVLTSARRIMDGIANEHLGAARPA
jgi:hypothetical protein